MSQQTSQPVDVFGDSGTPALSFKDAPHGTSYTGTVTKPAELVQSRDFETGNPAVWPDGNPKMSAVFSAEFDGLGERSVWAAKPSALFEAVQKAQRAAGVVLAPGHRVTITYTGDGVRRDGNTRLNPPKLYAVAIVPGDVFGEPTPAQQTYAAPAPQAASVGIPWRATFANFGQTEATWAGLPAETQQAIASAAPPF